MTLDGILSLVGNSSAPRMQDALRHRIGSCSYGVGGFSNRYLAIARALI
jgi:hypothetical protein